jgi:hypothetical protein
MPLGCPRSYHFTTNHVAPLQVSTDHTVLLDCKPHKTASILLGRPNQHRWSRVVVRQYPAGAGGAHAVEAAKIRQNTIWQQTTSHSLVLCGNTGPFSALPAIDPSRDTAPPIDTAPAAGSRAPSPCPFVNDPTALPDNWAALHDASSAGAMVAVNLLRIAPDMVDRYAELVHLAVF